jgi:hypothetical protein
LFDQSIKERGLSHIRTTNDSNDIRHGRKTRKFNREDVTGGTLGKKSFTTRPTWCHGAFAVKSLEIPELP